MAWQDVFPVSSPRIDAEEDREMRLAAQARAGADWALTALVARYQPPVTRYLTRITGNPDLAHRLAERVFVYMERRLHGPQGGRHLRLWLLRSSTEVGLDALRRPHRSSSPRLSGPPRPRGLLSEPGAALRAERLRAGLHALAGLTGQTSRQVRKLIWSARPEAPARRMPPPPLEPEDDESADFEEVLDQQDPREALRYRMIRAVLAELPYGDAQCLALHLIAGLNQAEVADALGLTGSATRRRIVQGLQLFAQRYNAAIASLGLPPEILAAVHPGAAPDPLDPGVAGYVPIQEQPTTALPPIVPEQPYAEQPYAEQLYDESTVFEPAETRSDDRFTPPARADVAAQPAAPLVVEALPIVEVAALPAFNQAAGEVFEALDALDAHSLVLVEPELLTRDTTPLPLTDAPAAPAAPAAAPAAEPLMPRQTMESVSALDYDGAAAAAALSPALAAEEEKDLTLPRTATPTAAQPTDTDPALTSAPRLVPVFSPPRARVRVDTLPRPGRPTRRLVASADQATGGRDAPPPEATTLAES